MGAETSPALSILVFRLEKHCLEIVEGVRFAAEGKMVEQTRATR